MKEERALATLPLLMNEAALTWWLGQDLETKRCWEKMKKTFEERYFPPEITKYHQVSEVWKMQQKQNESGFDFMAAVEVEAAGCEIEGDPAKFIVLQGLKTHIRQFVVEKEPADLNDIRKYAGVAEAMMTTETSSFQNKRNENSGKYVIIYSTLR